MCKVTEKCIREAIVAANSGPLKTWTFGLKAERVGDGFVVSKLFRKTGKGMEKLTDPLTAREASTYIDAFVTAATLANAGEGRG